MSAFSEMSERFYGDMLKRKKKGHVANPEKKRKRKSVQAAKRKGRK